MLERLAHTALPFRRAMVLVAPMLTVALTAAACNGGGSPAARIGPDGSATAEATGVTLSDILTATPDLETGPIIPSFGMPPSTEEPKRQNYRENPDYQLPDPADLPAPSSDLVEPEFHPPAAPGCPEGWEVFDRPSEGWRICHPDDWVVVGHGYVTVGVDDRFHNVSFFHFANTGFETAIVNIRTMPEFSRPLTILKECEQAYQVRFSGQLAGLCPDHPGDQSDVRVIQYHIPDGDREVLVSAVPRYDRNPVNGVYLDTWSEEDEARAIEIAHTFDLYAPQAAES